MIAESRWSERSHARRPWRQLQIGGLDLPPWLAAPYVVTILGYVLPVEMDKLHEAQEAAREGRVPWPEPMIRSREAFLLAADLDNASASQLRNIGRAMMTADKAARARAAPQSGFASSGQRWA